MIVCHDLLAAKATAYEEALRTGADEMIIVGGAEIFRQTIEEANRIYLTEIHAPFEGDVKFDFSEEGWKEIERRKEAEGGIALTFLTLQNVHAS